MEFISAEEFLKQEKKIQKVLLDWWKPSEGDLICIIPHIEVDGIDLEDDPIVYALKDYYDFRDAKKYIPLFTEGLLRDFIEDKINSKIKGKVAVYYVPTLKQNGEIQNTYDLVIKTPHGKIMKKYFNLGQNMLKVYWKVALEIAEGLLNTI